MDRPQHPDRARTRRRWLGAAPSVLGHLAILAVILMARGPQPPTTVPDEPVIVSLVQDPRPAPAPKLAAPTPKTTAKPLPRRILMRRPAARPAPDAAPAGKAQKPQAVNSRANLSPLSL
jgi:hypothetical protein